MKSLHPTKSSRHIRKLLSIWGIATACAVMIGVTHASAANHPLSRITPGTTIEPSGDNSVNLTRWNQTVLLAKPRIASGDTDKLGDMIRKSVSALTLTILATIKPTDNGTYQLAEVGVGYSVPIGGKQTVVSSDSASRLGAKLGLVTGHILSEHERRLQDIRLVTQTTSLVIFDTPAILFRHGTHRDYILRHLCWIDPRSGKGATLIWLLGKDSAGEMRVVDEPLRMVPWGTVEDRRIHVDGSQFLLGIPNERAFALEGLPPGTSIPWSNPLGSLAGQSTYTQEQLTELSSYLNHVISVAAKQASTE